MCLPAKPRRLLSALLATLMAGGVLAGTAAAQPGPPAPAPDQRLEQLRRMPPAERRETWRRMSTEERAAVRDRIPPERREEFSQRWQGRPGDADRFDGGRRLSPEERQRLRDQINETNRDLRWKGARRDESRRRERSR